MKINIILIALIAMIFTSCAGSGNTNTQDSNKNKKVEHSADDGHDHSADAGADSHSDDDGHDHSGDAGSHSEDDGHDHGGEAVAKVEASADEHSDDEIIFTEEQAAKVGLKVEKMAKQAFNEVIKTSGTILSAQGDEQTVVATSNGVLMFNRSNLAEGSYVKKGQIIMTISSKNIADGDPVAKAKIAFETSKRQFERAEKLVKDKIISVKEFEQASLNYQLAKTAYEGFSANADGKGVNIVAPISGYIKNNMLESGEYVSTGQLLLTIAQNSKLQLRAEVSEKYFDALNAISTANFKLPYSKDIIKLSDLNGKLLSVGSSTSENNFYIPVIFEFDNIGKIRTGSFVEIYLIASPKAKVISIPKSALVESQGLFFVYKKEGAEEYEQIEVKLGANNGERVEVLSGLTEGDSIVTEGVMQIKLASQGSAIPDSHSH